MGISALSLIDPAPLNRWAAVSVKSVAKLPLNFTVTSLPDTETGDGLGSMPSTLAKSSGVTEPESSIFSLNMYVIWFALGPVIAESRFGARPSAIATLVSPTP